jgi:hypothetical protein
MVNGQREDDRAIRRDSIVSPRMRDLRVLSIPKVLRFVAAGTGAKSSRIGLQGVFMVSKQTPLRHRPKLVSDSLTLCTAERRGFRSPNPGYDEANCLSRLASLPTRSASRARAL